MVTGFGETFPVCLDFTFQWDFPETLPLHHPLVAVVKSEKGLCPWQGLLNAKMNNLIADGSEQRKSLPAWLSTDGLLGILPASPFCIIPQYLLWFHVRLVFAVRAGFVLHWGPEHNWC